MKKTIFLLVFLFPFCFAFAAEGDSARMAAEELLKVMKTEEQMEIDIKQMRQVLIAPGSDQQMQEERFDSLFNEVSWPNIKEEMITVYAETFSENELKELTKFYNSPIGQKYVEKMPGLTMKIMQITQNRMQRIPQVQEMMELQKETLQQKIKSETQGIQTDGLQN